MEPPINTTLPEIIPSTEPSTLTPLSGDDTPHYLHEDSGRRARVRDDSGKWAGVRDDSARSHLMSPQLG